MVRILPAESLVLATVWLSLPSRYTKQRQVGDCMRVMKGAGEPRL